LNRTIAHDKYAESLLAARFRVTSRALAAAVTALGVAVLVGWIFDITTLRSLSPSLASMKANTALEFALLGVALWTADDAKRSLHRRLLALAVVTIALLTAVEYIFGVKIGIDELVFVDRVTRASGGVFPGRMAPATALGFMLLGASIAIWDYPALSPIRGSAVTLVFAIAFVALCGYILGVRSLYAIATFASVAVHTALGFLAASVSFVFARDVGMFASDTAAGRLARRLAPAIVVLPITLGWLRLIGQRAGLYDTTFGVALLVTGMTGSLAAILWLIGRSLYRHEVADGLERERGTERLRIALDAAPTGMLMIDDQGCIVLANSQIESTFGYSREELLGRSVEVLIPARFRASHPELRSRFAQDPHARAMGSGRELYALRRDGTEVPVEIGLSPVEAARGRFVLAAIVDISERIRASHERKQSEDERAKLLLELKALTRDLEARVEARTSEARVSEARYRTLFEECPVALFEIDYSRALDDLRELIGSGDARTCLASHPEAVIAAGDGVHFLVGNRRAVELFEAEDVQELANNYHKTFATDGVNAARDRFATMLEGKNRFDVTETRVSLAGRQLFLTLSGVALPGYEQGWGRSVVSMVDLTAVKQTEEKLRQFAAHQEVLVREIHHRVKNNLAVISSLFYLESKHVTDPKTLALLEESLGRIQSMALVHDTLHRSQDLANLDFAEYVRNLVAELGDTYRGTADAVHLKTDLQHLKISPDLAIPCGLIINELISNAFKHAFPNSRSGSVSVAIGANANRCVIEISDDGVGLPTEFDLASDASTGLRVIRALVRQISGSLEFAHLSPGTRARVSFPLST